MMAKKKTRIQLSEEGERLQKLLAQHVICRDYGPACQVNCHAAKRASANSLRHRTRPDIGGLSPVAHRMSFLYPFLSFWP